MRIFTQLKDDFSTKTHVTLRRSSRYRPPENLEMSGVCQPRPKVGGLGGLPRPKLRGCGPPHVEKKGWQTMIDLIDEWMDGLMDGWVDLFVFLVDWLIWLGWSGWLADWLIWLIGWLSWLSEWLMMWSLYVCLDTALILNHCVPAEFMHIVFRSISLNMHVGRNIIQITSWNTP